MMTHDTSCVVVLLFQNHLETNVIAYTYIIVWNAFILITIWNCFYTLWFLSWSSEHCGTFVEREIKIKRITQVKWNFPGQEFCIFRHFVIKQPWYRNKSNEFEDWIEKLWIKTNQKIMKFFWNFLIVFWRLPKNHSFTFYHSYPCHPRRSQHGQMIENLIGKNTKYYLFITINTNIIFTSRNPLNALKKSEKNRKIQTIFYVRQNRKEQICWLRLVVTNAISRLFHSKWFMASLRHLVQFCSSFNSNLYFFLILGTHKFFNSWISR